MEYRLERINQVNVNPKIGLTFASVLRATLRQDPDILLVGEIRDNETASIALRAAMTGHLVLSTLHTNDSISSAMRLVDIGVEGFMAASALRGVLAQRLVRRICAHCQGPYQPSHTEQVWLEEQMGVESHALQLCHGKGCTYCNNTGYSGRIGIFELLELDDAMTDALRTGDTASFAHAARHSHGFKTLAQSALEYASDGLTTLEEVFRVTEQMEEIADNISNSKAQSNRQGSNSPSSAGLSLEPMDR